MEDYRKLALEAAAPHAHDFDDLIEKAAKIEAFLLGQTVTSAIPAFRGAVISPGSDTKHDPILPIGHPQNIQRIKEDCQIDIPDELGVDLVEEAAEVVALARGLVEDIAELGYSHVLAPVSTATTIGEMADLVEKCDITAGPPPEDRPNLAEEMKMENFIVDETGENLRPEIISNAELFKDGDITINSARRFGLTTMLAAFARAQAAQGVKVLVITSNNTQAVRMAKLIQDLAVNVFSAQTIADLAHTGEQYDYVLIDDAASIPYALENRIKAYIANCGRHFGVVSTRKPGALVSLRGRNQSYFYGDDGRCYVPPIVVLASVPGQSRGWFFQEFTYGESHKLTCQSQLDKKTLKEIRQLIGRDSYENQFENKFRRLRDLNEETETPLTR